MGCGASSQQAAQPGADSQREREAPSNPEKLHFKQASVLDVLNEEKLEHDMLIIRYGSTLFKQLDVDGNGHLDRKELGEALKLLPRSKPKNVPEVSCAFLLMRGIVLLAYFPERVWSVHRI
jgi:hypothetical protein